jgi:hypothetical protein
MENCLSQALRNHPYATSLRTYSPRSLGQTADAETIQHCSGVTMSSRSGGGLPPPADADQTDFSSPAPPVLPPTGNMRRSDRSPERAKAQRVAWSADQEPELEQGLPERKPQFTALAATLPVVAGQVAVTGGAAQAQLQPELQPLPRRSRSRLAGAAGPARRTRRGTEGRS